MVASFFSSFSSIYSAVFPNKCSISLVAMGDVTEWESRVQFWDDVYGVLYVMSCHCACFHLFTLCLASRLYRV